MALSSIVPGPRLNVQSNNGHGPRWRQARATLGLAWQHRGLNVRAIADVTQLMAMSIADLLDDWFESPQVKGALASDVG